MFFLKIFVLIKYHDVLNNKKNILLNQNLFIIKDKV